MPWPRPPPSAKMRWWVCRTRALEPLEELVLPVRVEAVDAPRRVGEVFDQAGHRRLARDRAAGPAADPVGHHEEQRLLALEPVEHPRVGHAGLSDIGRLPERHDDEVVLVRLPLAAHIRQPARIDLDRCHRRRRHDLASLVVSIARPIRRKVSSTPSPVFALVRTRSNAFERACSSPLAERPALLQVALVERQHLGDLARRLAHQRAELGELVAGLPPGAVGHVENRVGRRADSWW